MIAGSRRVARSSLGAAVVLGALALVALPSGAADPEPADLIVRTRTASSETAIAGTIEVRWLVGGRYQVERTGARANGTGFVVGRGDRRAVGEDGVRWSAGAGPSVAWGAVADRPLPDPDAVWDLEVGAGKTVAGRATIVVRALDADDGRVRARFFVDQATDVLLRRDVLDAEGAVVRSVRFTQVRLAEGTPAVPDPPAPAPPPPALDGVPGSFPAPERLEPGFRLLGRYLHPDGAIQLFYGDGLFTLSLFEQPGVVDWPAVPDGGVPGEVGGNRAQSFATASGTVVVWGADGAVLTAVSDAPPDAVAAALESVESERGFFPRVADFVLGPFGWD